MPLTNAYELQVIMKRRIVIWYTIVISFYETIILLPFHNPINNRLFAG